MALPATEAFTDSDNTALQTHSSSWTIVAGALKIWSNACAGSGAAEKNLARWNADTFPNDQYAQMLLVAFAGDGTGVGPAARVDTAGAVSAYILYATNYGSQTRRLYKIVSGTSTELASDSTTESTSVTYRIETSGTTITTKKDGSQLFTDKTDSALSAGAGGIYSNYAANGSRSDMWESGSLVVAYTLSAAAGSYSLSGTAATPKWAHALSGSAGAYALSGTTATLKFGHYLAGASGSFTLTGTAASLLATRLLAGGAGSFVLAGTAASLLVGHTLAAGVGAFTFTGASASPLVGRLVTGGSGSFAVAGADVTLTEIEIVDEPAPSEVPGIGAFLMPFTAADFAKHVRFLAGRGEFFIAGGSAGMIWERRDEYDALRLAGIDETIADDELRKVR